MPLRDIRINDNLLLTMVNPAYMTRQVSDIAMKYSGIQFHITSLKPLRPGNEPTSWERAALQKFHRGVKEQGEFIYGINRKGYRYMAPLITKKSCLRCHAKQGYKEGDIRGGISVTLSFIPRPSSFPLILGHLLAGFCGCLLILFLGIKLNHAYDTIRKQATIDVLTGVANRRYFSERILSEFRRCKREKQPLSMILCDIDDFKKYNDNYGHLQGDDCLRRVATAINSQLNRGGDFCARYGGEEFVIILPNTPVEGALTMAEEIRAFVEGQKIPHQESPVSDFVTLSLGVSSDKECTIPYEDIIRLADEALLMAKKMGKNRVEIMS